jgi:four helix bundle protein
VHNHRRLVVWHRSYDLALNIYRATSSWPTEERYGLISQLRRAATSVPSNIAEGTSQESTRGFARYLRISLGSAGEIDTQLRLARDLGYLTTSDAHRLLDEVAQIKRMLVALITSRTPERPPNPQPNDDPRT